ncbi:hypothetical protein GWC95_19040 [Sediminibacterium roseum]|uniref:Lipoprotein n=1 Tax=Sediminibacterium roseum TaxID=1978412 RepID=A0ABX0A3M2_9BACT|nr:hypothetical protein [Sediminibacterium roseum]NCI52028.1 hypothetical protein [Sediminibacterium roseum]
MNKIYPRLVVPLIMVGIFSCQSIKKSSKFGLTEGYYTAKRKGGDAVPVYLFPDEDSIKVYRKQSPHFNATDSTGSLFIAFPGVVRAVKPQDYFLKQGTFDIDILSILFKYRPAISGFPNQLNTSILNGALFLGYRTDLYKINYNETPFGAYRRSVTHYGFSFGVFTGLGASRIDPSQGALSIEYDGLVNPSGLAAILAVDKFTFGLTYGVDHLIDKNHRFWIYQGKPWIGLGVGLNLN